VTNIISKKQEIPKAFWLYFYLTGNGTEWIDYDLPPPSVHKLARKGYFAGWAIDGYFGTKKGREYINDVIGRFLITFADCNPQRLPYKPKLDDNSAKIHQRVYKLREISRGLKSLPVKKYAPERADKFEDHAFWAIKFYAEDLIAQSGIIVYEILEQWALGQFEHKERSTIRAKCRSVWNWYNERNFEIPKKHKSQSAYLEETMASRAENMKRISRNKAERNKRAVINVMTGLYADDYKKKNGAWHFGKIGEATNLSAKTVAKIIKEIEAEKN